MSNGRHVSYNGLHIDMEALRNENAHVPAVGNMGTNARGDVLGKGGAIAKTADQVARENQRVRTPIQQTALKDGVEDIPDVGSISTPNKVPASPRKVEKELPNKDIVQDEDI